MNNQNKSLANYGDRDAVKEMADRIKRMLPGGSKMSDNDALSLAQVGLSHDLDPFNKEVWLIFNEETGKSYGIMVGIQGWRKHARNQSDYWGIGGQSGFQRIVDSDALKNYGANPNDIVYEYRITDTKQIDAWTKAVKNIREATGLTFNEVEKMVGPMPVSVGIGIFTPGERTKMKPHQAAMYRAERDCLRRRFQVKFGLVAGLPDVIAEPDDEQDNIIEAISAEFEDKADHEQRILEEMGFASNGSKPVADITVDLAYLSGIVDSEGKAYLMMTKEELSNRSIGIGKALAKNGLTAEKKAEYETKQAAIKEILEWLANH